MPIRKLVVFDVDGTLLQPGEVDDCCFVRSIAEVLGVADVNTDWGSYDCPTDSGIVFEIALRHSKSDIPKLISFVRKRYHHLLSHEVCVRRYTQNTAPGAIALLRMLVNHPIWCPAIATGGWRKPITLKLSLAGIDAHDIPLASSDDSYDRVDIIKRSVYRASKQQRVTHFQEIVYVGDGTWDQIAAERLGVCFVGVASDGLANGVTQIEPFSDPTAFIRFVDQVSHRFYQNVGLIRSTCYRPATPQRTLLRPFTPSGK